MKNIDQWDEYYTKVYNFEYFLEMMKIYKLYVVKQNNEIIGTFLLKTQDPKYWEDKEKAYYIHHFATKLGYYGLGIKMLDFMKKLAKQNEIKYLRLDCVQENERLNKYYKDYGFILKASKNRPYKCNLYEIRMEAGK